MRIGSALTQKGYCYCDKHIQQYFEDGAIAVRIKGLTVCYFINCNRFAKWVITDLSHYNPYSESK